MWIKFKLEHGTFLKESEKHVWLMQASQEAENPDHDQNGISETDFTFLVIQAKPISAPCQTFGILY